MKRVLIVDCDLGLANIDVLLRISSTLHIGHVLENKATFEEVIIKHKLGFDIIPASSGIYEFTSLEIEQKKVLFSGLYKVMNNYDYVFFDTGAGISSNILLFNYAADVVFVVITAEPTSLTDAYALMKVMKQQYENITFKIIVNQTQGQVESKNVYNKISAVCEKFIGFRPEYLGYITKDTSLTKSVMEQNPVVHSYPNSSSAKCFIEISNTINKMVFPISKNFIDKISINPVDINR